MTGASATPAAPVPAATASAAQATSDTLIVRPGAAGVALAPVMGAALGLLPEDLGERLMLGDAGANALGAALGLAAVLALGPGTRLAVTAALLALNVAADLTSFSRLIRGTPALDRLDRLGRLRAGS